MFSRTILLFRLPKFIRHFTATTTNPIPPLELTIAIVKPHAVAQPFIVKDIADVLIQEGFITVRSKRIQLTKDEASEFYRDHFGRFFYQRAVELMSSGPLVVNLIAGHDAIRHWRTLMGPTKVFRSRLTHPDSLRAKFGLTDTRNAVHGSDSIASTARECKFFFPDFQMDAWYSRMEPLCRMSARNIPLNHPIPVVPEAH
ncbi:putative Nucleoside diphosphate kinase 6 [Hypsibius exemplaris]|uniref:Nucleoside diphosphate kinase n=1 Tax=Hypsibius exemplaris TaxID=2072580 RepID=A0A9X6NFL1_HYPEX|nr:putative Nucleoside diphosphate kinase 6 [Hypsibius exemplaris]